MYMCLVQSKVENYCSKYFGRITREIRRQKMISLVENLSADHCLSSPAYIFDIPSEVVDYIIDKDIDLSTYSYIDTIQRGNKKLVTFGTFGLVEKFIIFMLVEKHRSFNIYPCTMKNKNCLLYTSPSPRDS